MKSYIIYTHSLLNLHQIFVRVRVIKLIAPFVPIDVHDQMFNLFIFVIVQNIDV